MMLITVQPVRLPCTFPGNAHKKSKKHYSGQRELPNVRANTKTKDTSEQKFFPILGGQTKDYQIHSNIKKLSQ